MNKVQLAEKIAEKENFTKKAALELVDIVLDQITEALLAGEPVKLSGFGNFSVKEKPARLAKNPITKATVKVPASKKVSFKPSELFKEKF
ncbi:DNA-binding protein HU [bioreactor metagenome]|jgi:nucleoid DNA-binding protein|uniref:DNA-binding protein HU n=1 Tax=bioreactor metagenome TaxID=1076179 RepID=A0A645HD32_9ZZZZ|nr:HU family DNA-binding protein [Bacilli bacterium]MEA4820651.1 HU family DNA-binding protein [Erysipelotrichales bacterium]